MPVVGPFDEFSKRWYLIVGTPITISVGLQVFIPHISIFLGGMGLCCKRCMDRGCGTDTKNTSKVIQSEYEDLYTGPEILLHVRMAQIMSTVFVTFTYSSGLPMLYGACIFMCFVFYWTDKIAMLCYYRKDKTSFKSTTHRVFMDYLPWAIIVHFMFGGMMYSYPYLCNSPLIH